MPIVLNASTWLCSLLSAFLLSKQTQVSLSSMQEECLLCGGLVSLGLGMPPYFGRHTSVWSRCCCWTFSGSWEQHTSLVTGCIHISNPFIEGSLLAKISQITEIHEVTFVDLSAVVCSLIYICCFKSLCLMWLFFARRAFLSNIIGEDYEKCYALCQWAACRTSWDGLLLLAAIRWLPPNSSLFLSSACCLKFLRDGFFLNLTLRSRGIGITWQGLGSGGCMGGLCEKSPEAAPCLIRASVSWTCCWLELSQ